MPADALSAWSLAEQDAWIAAPQGPPAFADCIGIVDATYIRVQRPRSYALERRCYSTYKKYHALFFLAIVDRRGERQVCREADRLSASAHHFAYLFSLSGRFRLIDHGNYPVGSSENIAFCLLRPWLRPGLKLLADVAYTGDSSCRVPYKAPQLTVEAAGSAAEAARRRAYNQQLSSQRQRVEHSFARIKKTFRLLQSTWQLPLDQLPRTFRAAALLCNWLHRTRNLYSVD